MNRPPSKFGWPLLRDSALAAWNVVAMRGRSYRGPLEAPSPQLLETAAELKRHVVQLAEGIGERNVSQRPAALSLAGDYIEATWQQSGLVSSPQEYTVANVVCRNLEIEIPGTRRPDEIVVVGAHYDSVPGSPAANDNASGIAAMFHLAQALAQSQHDRTLRLVAFVNEELPYAHTENMGSWVYARQCRERGDRVTAMLSLETIGYYAGQPGTQRYPPWINWLYTSRGNFIAFIGNTRHGKLVRRAVRSFRQSERFPSEGAALPEVFRDISRSDHWSFWQEGYPALMVTDTANFRYPYYHTPHDTPDKIDFERTARVVRGLQHVIADLLRSPD